MPSDDTKIVQKTKEILKEMGVEVKTTQIYEMYSKVLGYKNWNVLKSTTNSIIEEIKKKKDFKSLLGYGDLSERVKTMETLTEQELKSIISLIHIKMQHTVEELTLNDYGVTHIVDWGFIDNKPVKVAVIAKLSGDEKSLYYKKVTEKHIIRLNRFMDQHKCSHGIIYSSEHNISSKIYKFATEMRVEVVDYEDLLRMAMKADGLS